MLHGWMDVDIVTAVAGSVYHLPIHILKETLALTSCIVSDALIHTMPNLQQVREAFKKFVDWHTTRYAHHILSLFNIDTCNWNVLGPARLHHSESLWYRCRRIVVPGLPASHLPCNTNTHGEYVGRRSSSKPKFWMAASAWADLWSDALSWLQVTSVFS